MPSPRVCILRAPGTNCDIETAYAFDTCGAKSEAVHLQRLIAQPDLLRSYQILCIPGGFSYGDDIGAGVVFASQLRARLHGAIAEFLQSDALVLGICNGFQTLLKAGVLPDGTSSWNRQADETPTATLTWNDNGKYTARWVRLRVQSSVNVFLKGIEEIDLPIAHAEGRLIARDADVQREWEQQGQGVLTYIPWQNADETTGPAWAANPNGSLGDLAGLGDASGRVLGLMPHPERYLFATQHPQWTRRGLTGDGAGRQLFANAVAYFG